MSNQSDMDRHISAVMEALNWPEDTLLPIVNEKNRELIEKMQALLSTKEAKSKHLEQLTERFEWLSEHHKNAQADVVQNLKLLEANRRQCETEYHMFKLAENDKSTTSKIKSDIKHESVKLDQQNQSIEHEMLQLNEKIDRLGADMHWMRDALIEWTQAIEQGGQTNELIEKYCQDDQKKANAFEIRRQALQEKIRQSRLRLSNLENETMSVEQILDRTANLYRQTHEERREMIVTWRSGVQTLNNRDEAIRASIDKVAKAREMLAMKTMELKEQTEFLDQQFVNNKESEYAIDQLNEQIGQVRGQLNQINDAIQLDANELIGMKRLIQSETNRLQQIRQKNRQIKIDCEAKAKATQKLKTIVEDLMEKLQQIRNQKSSAEDRLRHLDELYEHEENAMHNLELEMSRLSQMSYKSQQVLQQWENEEKTIENEIYTLETTIKSISNNFLNQEKDLARQMEIQYDIHFKTLALEIRIAKMQGKAPNVNPDLSEKCECLEKMCAATKEKREHIRRQLASAVETERRLTTQLLKEEREHSQITEKLHNSQLNCESGQKSVCIQREALHERMVEHSLLKMRLNQMATMYSKQMEKFCDLEQHKFELKMAIDERLVDLKCQLDLLALKRKHLRTERDVLRADISERKCKIDALHARFELANDLLGKNEDGTIVSAIQLRIETAQEKELLMDQGSKLNEKVINAEKDIKALENTLILLNISNDQYKRKLGQIQENDECNEKLQQLSDEYANAMVQLKAAKSNLDKNIKVVNELQRQKIEYENETEQIERVRLESNDALIKVHKEILDQNSKVERAKRELKLAKKAMIKKVDDREYVRIFEKDLTAKELESRNTMALQQLAEMVDTVSGIGSIVTKHLYEKGLEMPTHNQSGTCSRNRSRASMRSSGRNSEYSLNLNSRDDDGIISRMSERTFSSTSSISSSSVKSTKSEKSSIPTASLDFQIEGQSIRCEKNVNNSKSQK